MGKAFDALRTPEEMFCVHESAFGSWLWASEPRDYAGKAADIAAGKHFSREDKAARRNFIEEYRERIASDPALVAQSVKSYSEAMQLTPEELSDRALREFARGREKVAETYSPAIADRFTERRPLAPTLARGPSF
jgi:hypothetical protein